MPAVRHLDRFGQRFRHCLAIAATAVARDDGDLLMLGQPGSDGRDLAVRQESDDPAPLQIAHDAAVAMVSAPRPWSSSSSQPRSFMTIRVCTQVSADVYHSDRQAFSARTLSPANTQDGACGVPAI